MSIIPVILSGGSGSRLWPVSRQSFPKPFIKLPDGETLIYKTYKRVSKISGVDAIYTITNRDYYFMSKDEINTLEAGSDIPKTFILEPFGRNTAPAIAMAALCAREQFGHDAKLLILSADHLIEDNGLFNKTVEYAAEIADHGHLVTFGIEPTRPETGYGYIKTSNQMPFENSGLSSFNIEKFVEKPSLDIAIQYLESGNFLWNSGMFCFRCDAILDALEKHEAELYSRSISCYKSSIKDGSNMLGSIEITPECFDPLPNISIDCAVMEKADDVVVIPSNFDWSDIGCWQSMGKMISEDDSGNRIDADTVLVDVENTMIQSRNRLVAGVGLKNLVIVDTDDALLISDAARVQDVKKVVDKLKIDCNDVAVLHSTVTRPWGTYTVLGEGEGYKIKRIVVKSGASLSLQMHHHRSEHWVVVNGFADVVNGDQTLSLKENESTFIPSGNRHRLTNPGLTDLVMIEVQSGKYLGEDDIVRFEDKYGRS